MLRAILETKRRLTLLVSVPLLIEYEAVMTRPEHLKAARLSAVDVNSILDGVAGAAEPVKQDYLLRPALPDVDDDMVLDWRQDREEKQLRFEAPTSTKPVSSPKPKASHSIS